MNGFPVTGNVTLEHLRTLYQAIKERVEFLNRVGTDGILYWSWATSESDPGEPQPGGLQARHHWGYHYIKALRGIYRRAIVEMASCYCKDPTDDDLPPWTARELIADSCREVIGPAWTYPTNLYERSDGVMKDVWPWYSTKENGTPIGHLQYDINVMAAALDRLRYPLAFLVGSVWVDWFYKSFHTAYKRSNTSWDDILSQDPWIHTTQVSGLAGGGAAVRIRSYPPYTNSRSYGVYRSPMLAITLSALNDPWPDTLGYGTFTDRSPRAAPATWLSSLSSGRMRVHTLQSTYHTSGQPDPGLQPLVFSASNTEPALPWHYSSFQSPVPDTSVFDGAYTPVLTVPAGTDVDETKDISHAGPYWRINGANDTQKIQLDEDGMAGASISASWGASLADNPSWDGHEGDNYAQGLVAGDRIVLLRGGGSLPDEPEDPEEPYEPGGP